MKAAKKAIAFLLLWNAVVLLYLKAWNSGLVFDFVDWWGIYNTMGWSAFPTGFPDIAVRYFLHLVSLPIFLGFGSNPLLWFLQFTFLHATAAFLAVTVFTSWYKAAQTKNRLLIVVLGSLLFITSPFQSEVVVWKICLLYLIALNAMLLMLLAYTQFARTGKKLWIMFYYLIFSCALLTHEISMFFIPLIAVVIIKLRFGFFRNLTISKGVLLFVLPSLAFIVAYLLLNKIMIGVWLGHYGTDVHFNFDLVLLSSTFTKYIFKFLFLSQCWAYEWKHSLYLFFEKPVVAYTALIIYAVIAAWLLLKNSKPGEAIYIVLLAGFCFMIAPVLNLYFVDWMPIHGDRLGYVASLFFYFAIVGFAAEWTGFKSLFVLIPWLIFGVYFQNQRLQDWKDSEDTMTSIHNNFNLEDSEQIFLLAVADNFNGAYMYRNIEPSPFAATMVMKSGKDIRGKTSDILRFNMCRKEDGVDAKVISEREVQLTFTGWCSWWWSRDNNGFETEDYTVRFENNAAFIYFKNKPEGAVYLYQQGGILKRLENF